MVAVVDGHTLAGGDFEEALLCRLKVLLPQDVGGQFFSDHLGKGTDELGGPAHLRAFPLCRPSVLEHPGRVRRAVAERAFRLPVEALGHLQQGGGRRPD